MMHRARRRAVLLLLGGLGLVLPLPVEHPPLPVEMYRRQERHVSYGGDLEGNLFLVMLSLLEEHRTWESLDRLNLS